MSHGGRHSLGAATRKRVKMLDSNTSTNIFVIFSNMLLLHSLCVFKCCSPGSSSVLGSGSAAVASAFSVQE